MSNRIAAGLSRVVVAVFAAGGLLGTLVAAAAPADAVPVALYAAPSPAGTEDCLSAVNACTLASALSDAVAGDTVYLVQAGIEATPASYYIGNWSVSTSGTSAAARVTIEPAPGVTSAPILDGNGTSAGACETTGCDGPVLTVGDNVDATVEGITIENADNTMTENGGGIANLGGAVTVSDSTFTGNYARLFGGAIGNGDISGSGTVTVSDCTFTDNSAGDGGAIDNGDNGGSGTLSVTDSTFTGNSARADGGAIDNGDNGGSGTVTVSDSTFTGNSVRLDGGAIDNGDEGSGTLTVSESTFTDNSATDGGTIDSGDNESSGTVYVAADIFDGSCDQAGGSWNDAGYNVGTDASCENGGTGDSTALTSGELGPLADNGGPTETALPLEGNPALGIVPNLTSVMPNGDNVALCPVTDQRGVASPAGLACNAGAVQGSADLYAAPSAIGTGDCSSAADACTLETAVSEAAPGYTVYLVQPGTGSSPSSYYIGNWDVATSGTSSAAQVTIEPAPGVESPPILDGDGTSAGTCETTSCDGPVLTIGANVYATVEGITIQNGDNTSTDGGGGIDNASGGTVTVSDSAFTGNSAGDGGAIDNAGGGTVTVSDSAFTGNSAGFGGAIANGDDVGTGTLSVTDSTFTGNSAGFGGAIDNGDDSGDDAGGGTVGVSDSTFTGNSAKYHGGAINNGDIGGSGIVTVSDSTFTGNSADRGGTIDNGDAGGSGTVYVAADIFNGSCDQVSGSWDDAGYNVGTDASCENGGTADSTALTGGELGALANNGGPTETVLPLTGNPALGIVPNPTSVSLDSSTVALCPVTDQRGVGSTPGAACDAGAVQVPPSVRPVVTAVSPGAGPVSGGTFITITGRHFSSGSTVELGQGTGPGPSTIMATGVDVVSPTKITATTGGVAKAGKWNVFVVSEDGTSRESPADQFRYELAPAVTSLSPGSGAAAGGTKVTIHGSRFTPGATVSFGTKAATHVAYVSVDKLTVTSPAGSGTVAVTVTTPGGTSHTSAADKYRYT